jgi:hypothetical protein
LFTTPHGPEAFGEAIRLRSLLITGEAAQCRPERARTASYPQITSLLQASPRPRYQAPSFVPRHRKQITRMTRPCAYVCDQYVDLGNEIIDSERFTDPSSASNGIYALQVGSRSRPRPAGSLSAGTAREQQLAIRATESPMAQRSTVGAALDLAIPIGRQTA